MCTSACQADGKMCLYTFVVHQKFVLIYREAQIVTIMIINFANVCFCIAPSHKLFNVSTEINYKDILFNSTSSSLLSVLTSFTLW